MYSLFKFICKQVQLFAIGLSPTNGTTIFACIMAGVEEVTSIGHSLGIAVNGSNTMISWLFGHTNKLEGSSSSEWIETYCGPWLENRWRKHVSIMCWQLNEYCHFINSTNLSMIEGTPLALHLAHTTASSRNITFFMCNGDEADVCLHDWSSIDVLPNVKPRQQPLLGVNQQWSIKILGQLCYIIRVHLNLPICILLRPCSNEDALSCISWFSSISGNPCQSPW